MSAPYRANGEVTPTLTVEDERELMKAVGRGDNRASIGGIIAAIVIATVLVTLWSLVRT